MTTLKSRFTEKAKELMGNHEELQDFSGFLGDNNNADHIDEYMFSVHGEYIGGMSSVILVILEQ
jgi:hypothetical protein